LGSEDPELLSLPRLVAQALLIFGRLSLLDECRALLVERVENGLDLRSFPDLAILGG